MSKSTSDNALAIPGLAGANPLAFLAALGLLRTATHMLPSHEFRLSWKAIEGNWRPLLHSNTSIHSATFSSDLAEFLSVPSQISLLEKIGDNLTLSPEDYKKLAISELEQVEVNSTLDRASLDFLAAFGCEVVFPSHSKDRSQIQDTALRTMSGAGHQHFIKFMRDIIANTTAEHLTSTLFYPWTYHDEGRGLNLRWDPQDDRRYAMRWKEPSSDPSVTMRGANRLAIEAIPLLATAPEGSDLITTGFRTIPRRGTFFTWPIWTPAIGLPTIRSLLQHSAFATEPTIELLAPLGVAAIYRSQRITVGKFRNFTPAKAMT